MKDNIICEMLGIRYPIIQGAMAWIANGNLAAAVSNAGGIGLIAGGGAPADVIANEIDIARSKTDKPFGVNIMLMSPFASEIANLCVLKKVSLITTGAGNPGKYMNMWKEAGIKVFPVVPSVALAKRMERAGADAVICEGQEAGGHIGEATTMCLVPQVVDALSIPVIAAGGIADGRGIAATFMLGAKAVQVGTRFLSAFECEIHQNYKDEVIGAKDTDTVVTGRFTGHPVRSLKNKFTKSLLLLEKEECDLERFEELSAGSLRMAVKEGDKIKGSFMAGQIAGLVTKQESCEDIITGMINQAKELLNQQW